MTVAPLRIAIAQINPTVGDLAGNSALVLQQYAAVADACDLVVFPELALTGYPPEDLILSEDFCEYAMRHAEGLAIAAAQQSPQGAALAVGGVWVRDGMVHNAALLMDAGRIAHVQPKTMLPNYGVFDEKRLFAPGEGPVVCEWRGVRLGMMVCEDMWYPAMSAEHARQEAELLVVINASPFEAGKLSQRKDVAARAVAQAGVPLVYANMVGAQDDIVFDGGSFAMAADGRLLHQSPEFDTACDIVALHNKAPASVQEARGAGGGSPIPFAREGYGLEESIWRAMMLGLRDYVHKNGFSGVVLGISGGIDSAVTAAVAADALGAQNVTGVMLPSPFSSPESIEDAQHLAGLLCIRTMTLPITEGMEVCEHILNPLFKQEGWITNPLLGGNLQARLRGLMLMALSNRFGWMLLTTGNKSEIAVGYSTLYGDSCGGFNVLKDLYKTQVYALAHWRNAQGEAIPQRSIDKPPSAELAPGQKDQDQLPPYDVLDDILFHHIEMREQAQRIIERGFDAVTVHRVLRMVRQSEYKRRQSAPGVKLSPMLFGKDRRFPLTNKF